MVYDYIIKNGKMIDFETKETYVGDLYIKDGIIVAPVSDEEAHAKRLVNAAGKYVVPGLIDEHAHWNYEASNLGADADMVCPGACVTTSVDAGSSGAANFEQFYRQNIMRYTTDVRAYLHVSSFGVKAACAHEEEHDPADIQEEEIIRLFDKYPEVLRGIKVRYSIHTMGTYGFEPIKKAVELADKINGRGHHCHVAVHCAELPENMDFEGLLNCLRPGDIYTHLYQNLGPTIFDKTGKVRECIKEARKRGVVFSTGNGAMHWNYPNYESAFKDGFYPDIISSDVVRYNKFLRPGFSLTYPMCTTMIAGMNEIDILKAVTYTPAEKLGLLNEIGTLKEGTRADVAIMDIIDAEVPFRDRFGNERISERIFVPLMTIKSGEAVFRQVFFGGGYDFDVTLENYV